MKDKLGLLLILASSSLGVDGLKVLDQASFVTQTEVFAEVFNPNGEANAVRIIPSLLPIQSKLHISSSDLTFEGVNAKNTAAGFNFESSLWSKAQPKVSFSGGSIGIGQIISTQGDAYGVKSAGKATFELYHSLLVLFDASVEFGSIKAAQNAYGLQANKELVIRGSGNFNRGEMKFNDGISAGNDLYGISSPIFKLTGTNLAFKGGLEGGSNVYGIRTNQELLIQESKTTFSPLKAQSGDAYGIWAEGASKIQNSDMSDEVTLVAFDAITAGQDAYAFRSRGSVSLRNTKLSFGAIQGGKRAFGLYNEGATYSLANNFFNDFGGVVRFDSLASQDESVGIYNAGGVNQILLQKGSITFGAIRGESASYGIKTLPSATFTLAQNYNLTDGRSYGLLVRFGHIFSKGDAYGMYTQASTNIVLGGSGTLDFGLIEGKNAYGIYADYAPVHISLTNSTLSLALKGANQKAFMQNGNGTIKLTLNESSRVFIDGDGGVIDVLNIKKDWSDQQAIIDLSGNHHSRNQARKLEIKQYSNVNRYSSTQASFGLFYSRANAYADKLVILNADARDGIWLNLYTLPSDLKASSQSKQIDVADVDSKITVNGIKTSGGSGASTVVQGFEAYTTKLYREDSGSRSRYFIDTADTSELGLSLLSLGSLINLSNQYNLHFYNLGSVSKRLGMMRKGHDSGGLWGRMSAGRVGNLTGISAFSVELGGDYALKNYKEGLDFYVGGHFAYTTSYHNEINDDPNALELGIYGAVMSDVGWYYYTQIKGEYLQNKISSPIIENFQINQGILTLSQELGYRLDFGQKGGFYIEPKANLDLSVALPTSYEQKHSETSMILKTQIQPLAFLNGKLGGDIGYSFISASNLKTDFYIGASYDYILFAPSKVKFQTQNLSTTLDTQNRFLQGLSVGLGTHIQASRHIKLTMDFDLGLGNPFYSLVKGSFGFKYSF